MAICWKFAKEEEWTLRVKGVHLVWKYWERFLQKKKMHDCNELGIYYDLPLGIQFSVYIETPGSLAAEKPI